MQIWSSHSFSLLYMACMVVGFLEWGVCVHVWNAYMHTWEWGELHVQHAHMDTAAVWGVFGTHKCTYKTNGISFWKGWVCMYSMHICTWTGDIWRERGTLDIIPPPSV